MANGRQVTNTEKLGFSRCKSFCQKPKGDKNVALIYCQNMYREHFIGGKSNEWDAGFKEIQAIENNLTSHTKGAICSQEHHK